MEVGERIGGLERETEEEEEGEGTRMRAPNVRLGPPMYMPWAVEGRGGDSDRLALFCEGREFSLREDEREMGCACCGLRRELLSEGDSRGRVEVFSGGRSWRLSDFRRSCRVDAPREDEGRAG